MKSAILLIACVVATCCGCQQVTVRSDPVGAVVHIDSRFCGTTPTRAFLSTNRDHTVVISMPGYAPKTIQVERVKRRPIVPPALGLLSTGFSLAQAIASANPAGILVSVYGRLLYDRYNYDLEPRHISIMMST